MSATTMQKFSFKLNLYEYDEKQKTKTSIGGKLHQLELFGGGGGVNRAEILFGGVKYTFASLYYNWPTGTLYVALLWHLFFTNVQ
jgi:hypothetical protein